MLTFDATTTGVAGENVMLRLTVVPWWAPVAMRDGPECEPNDPRIARDAADIAMHVADVREMIIDGRAYGPWSAWLVDGRPVAGRNLVRAMLEAHPALADQVRSAINHVSHSGLN